MTSRKHIFAILSTFVVSLIGVAQPPVPEVLPPSPDPAAFVKAGLGNINFSTGAVQASIPLFDLKVANIAHSVSLSYQSQGTKVDEICSRVGLGWNLNIGGVITRTVRGAPDELGNYWPEPADIQAMTMATYRYFDLASQADPVHEYDTQKDEFSFSVAGYSGKFILDSANNAVIQSHSNVKIKAYTGYEDFTGFIMTTPDGLKYYFGQNDAYEKTVTHSLYAYSHYASRIKTSFFLTKIENLAGQTMIFNYLSMTIVTRPGITHTVLVRRSTLGSLVCNHCPTQNTILSNAINVSSVTYDTRYLTSVECSNGMRAELHYVNRPDSAGDKRLSNIILSSQEATLKHYSLTYYDQSDGSNMTAGGVTAKNGRYFLNKVSYTENPPEDESVTLEYKLDYNDPSSLPGRLTPGQDYLGFYNGQGNNGCFIPANEELTLTTAYANRDYDWLSAAKGVLQKITYPTGGTEEFFLEANTIPQLVQANTYDTLEYIGYGTGTPGVNSINTHYGTSFPIYREQKAIITASSFQDPGYSGSYYPAAYDYIVRVKLKNLTTGTYAFQATLYAYSNAEYEVNLYPGNTYRMELLVYQGSCNMGKYWIKYDYSAEDIFDMVNAPNGGIRVRKIRMYDSLTDKRVEKFFRYASLDDLSKSSGVGSIVVNPLFKERAYSSILAQSTPCPLFENPNAHDPMRGYEICINDAYSSNTASTLNAYDRSHIYYTSIIESDDSLFANGGTEYKFYNPTSGRTDYIIMGAKPPGVPDMNYPVFNGIMKEKNTFRNDFSFVKQESYEYMYDSAYYVRIPSVDVRRKYIFYPADSAANNTVFWTDVFDAFDVVKYEFQSMWIKLAKTKVKEIDPNGVVRTDSTLYYYGDPVNAELFKAVSTNSKDQSIEKIKYYPTDYPLDATLQKLVAKNRIAVPVEEVTKINGTEVQRQKIIYDDWYGDQKVLEPLKVQVKSSPADALHDELLFNSYNRAGQITNYSKVDDIKISYLYDYTTMLPIAEVKNADTTQFAVTSFETADRGNWEVLGAMLTEGEFNPATQWTIYPNEGVTGSTSFGGRLRKYTDVAVTYILTLWCKNGYAATAQGNTGTLLINRNGWNLYKWEFSSTEVITVQGDHIDEVRLHPQKALMTSFTYNTKMGVSATCDMNNNVSYYEYDLMHRLWIVRDGDNNIIKKYDYKYKASMPCPNTSAGWENTSTALRCQVNGSFEFTGYQEQEQKDMNPCSATFGQLRWIEAGYNETACPLEIEDLTVTYDNDFTLSGFTVQFTNTLTSAVQSFTAGANSSGTLASLPAGTYNITITKITSGMPWGLLFGTGCSYQSGITTATFNNVVIDDCHHITIAYDEL